MNPTTSQDSDKGFSTSSVLNIKHRFYHKAELSTTLQDTASTHTALASGAKTVVTPTLISSHVHLGEHLDFKDKVSAYESWHS